MARREAFPGAERIAAQGRVGEGRIDAEPGHHGCDDGIHKQPAQHRLRNPFRMAGTHRDHGRAVAAGGHQEQDEDREQVAREEQGDPAVPRARLGP